MDYQVENNVITVKFPYKVTTNNAKEFEEELFALPVTDDTGEVVLDAAELEYISSAGLRVILGFSKKKYSGAIRIINASLEIYEVFRMTGFVQMFEVVRALRYIDISGLRELGRGMYGAVYRIDDETILKTFHGVNSREVLDGIIDNARKAFVKGIPVIIPFDTVKTDAGLGMIFEQMRSDSLADMMHADPESIPKYVGKMAELAKIMATTEFEPGEIRYRNDMLREEMKTTDFIFTEDEINELIKYIDAVPERNTAVHGDFHARNIYMSDDSAMLIDLDDFCLGHPIWDIACLYRVYPYMIGLTDEESAQVFALDGSIPYTDFYYQVMHVSMEEVTRIWERFLELYLEGFSDEEKAAFLETSKFYSDFMIIRFLIDQCRKEKDNPDKTKLDNYLSFIRGLMAEMRKKDLDQLIRNIEPL